MRDKLHLEYKAKGFQPESRAFLEQSASRYAVIKHLLWDRCHADWEVTTV